MTEDKDDKNINIVKGEFRKPRQSNVPVMPQRVRLSPAMKEQWQRVMKMLAKDLLCPCDGLVLELLCGCLVDYERIKGEIELHPDQPVFMELLKMCSENISIWFAQFYMTPASRRELRDKKE